jgi:hypothetical protein
MVIIKPKSSRGGLGVSVRGGYSDESTTAHARIVVSLSYVQTLRRELQAGRLNTLMVEDYLERLEGHLVEAERNSAVFASAFPGPGSHDTPDDGNDIMISEHLSRF